MAKIHAEMLATMKETGFKGDFPAFLQFLRTDPQFYAKTPEELLMRAAFISKEFDGKAHNTSVTCRVSASPSSLCRPIRHPSTPALAVVRAFIW